MFVFRGSFNPYSHSLCYNPPKSKGWLFFSVFINKNKEHLLVTPVSQTENMLDTICHVSVVKRENKVIKGAAFCILFYNFSVKI